MTNRMREVLSVLLAVVAIVALFALSIWLQVKYEQWRASLWAEEMRKAGVKTEVPK